MLGGRGAAMTDLVKNSPWLTAAGDKISQSESSSDKVPIPAPAGQANFESSLSMIPRCQNECLGQGVSQQVAPKIENERKMRCFVMGRHVMQV